MNKRNLMMALTLLLIICIGLIVPRIISNQSGVQQSRQLNGETLLLSKSSNRSRRSYLYKHRFLADPSLEEEELEEDDDADELDELELELEEVEEIGRASCRERVEE